MKKRNSAGRLLAILLVALLVPAMTACSAKDGDQMTEQTEQTEQSETGSVTSDEPQNEEEALALYRELMEQENKILSENTDLWEKVYLEADKGILSLNQTETKMDWGRNGDKVKGFMRSKEPGGTDERVGRTHTPEIPRVIPGRSIYGSFGLGNISNSKNYFVPGGQSTQLIVGATPESDYQMVAVAEALYRNFGLKRSVMASIISF